jgi:hypothetical protein
MQNTRQSWLSAAHGAAWFRLNRHDDPEPEPTPDPQPDPEPAPDDADPDPEGADKLGDKGKQALDRMKAEKADAKRTAAAEKKRADELARKVSEFEDRDKSELEKATSKAERAAERATKATARAVKAEVKAAASGFADPEDAIAFLDMAKYTDDDGEIDTEAISTDLTELLERKPHLRRPEAAPAPESRKGPKPDPSQGPRKDPEPTDWRTADKADFKKHIAKYGARLP